jgi:hypothetical protein
MKIYLRFDEDGKQTEVATLTAKPTALGWKTAPANFDFSKRYKLSGAGKIEEISEDELAATRFTIFKARALDQAVKLIDASRNAYVGSSAAKRKSYELQEKAARAVIEDVSSACLEKNRDFGELFYNMENVKLKIKLSICTNAMLQNPLKQRTFWINGRTE